MTSIYLSGVSKSYGTFQALHEVDFSVEKGEMLTLLGPSGCGKTTMLRLIAGLLEPTAGKILFENTVVNSVPPHKRNVGLVFQNYSLFPHMTVFQNVAFGLRMRGVADQQIKTQVQQMLDLVQLGSQGNRYPSQLSGGQQQRVGLARALVIKPAVLLLDEPFGALDKKLRESMQLELRQIQQTLKVTSIFVTHDQEEALTLSDRIAVMNKGRIEQIAAPRVMYEAPATGFVLHFVGASNSFNGKVASVSSSGIAVQTPQGFMVHASTVPADIAVGDEVVVAIRPEKGWLVPEGQGEAVNSCPGIIKGAIYLGSVTHYYIDGPQGQDLVVYHLNSSSGRAERPYQPGERIHLCWDAANTLVFRN